MATFQADQVRAVAIELRDKISTLYIAALPIFREVHKWTLNGFDAECPPPFDVRVQVDAYKAITLETLKLDWVTEIRTAVYGDTNEYPQPPAGSDTLIFDEYFVFDDPTIF